MADPAPANEPNKVGNDQPIERKPREPMPMWMRWAIVVIAVLGAFGIQSLMAGRRTEAVKREAFAQGVSGLTIALVQPALQRDVPKLQRTIEQIAQTGGYSLILVTDKDGRVIASTDRAQDNKVIDELKRPPISEVKISGIPGGIRGDRAIVLGGDNVLGVLRVESKVGS